MKKKFLLSIFVLLVTFNAFALKGDVNGDGVVTATDVTTLYNYLLNGDETYLSTSDVDGDGYITSADITQVYNILLNGPEPEITEYTVNGVTFKMVDVEGGTFTMGASSNDANAESDERPQHQVTVSSFAIGQTEVTQELWTAVMGSNPSLFDENNKYPVHSITWNDCQNFIAALNSQLHITGYEFAMPTEAQWEFAAHGGNQSKGYYYVG
ncbi:MAG: SUMF1/EgtB/PvdO family nonheme iron enzyme, partial [Muribaculaceae bacterium]|nr:SUMF1/EgtB/PvdO family nonheme iron enzyme [Muribaculaceae bacterium]